MTLDLLSAVKANIDTIMTNIENRQSSDDLDVQQLKFNEFEFDLTIDPYIYYSIKSVDVFINDGEQIFPEIINLKEAEKCINSNL